MVQYVNLSKHLAKKGLPAAGSADDPKDQKQEKRIQQNGSACAAPRQSAELNALGSQRIRFIVPVLVVESFVLGPSAHQW